MTAVSPAASALQPAEPGVAGIVGAPPFPAEADALRRWRNLAPARIALVDRARGVRLDYATLDADVERWKGVLRAHGVRAGDRVAALAWNRHELVSLYCACGRLGAALVPLNWRLSVPELLAVLRHARVALLVGEARFRDAGRALVAEPSLPDVGWLDLDDELPALLERHAGEAGGDAPIGPETPRLVLYTSGSTGAPKGVLLTQRQIFYNALATRTAWELGPTDVAPVSTPFFHTGGWNVFATPMWEAGGTVVLFDRFDPGDFLDALAEERCTVAFAVPTQFIMLLEHRSWGRPLPALRWMISGGAPCPQSVAARIRAAGIRMREGFGLTECGPNCFAISDEATRAKPGSVGWPISFLEMRLVDEAGADVPPGEVGELLLRGPQLFGGYLFDAERTAEVMAPGGWLRTGDLARRDADGAYTIAGRRKEMYISGGENVYPGEVEAAIADCPGVAEAVVVGMPDARWGEVGCAFVVARPGHRVTTDDVLAQAGRRLARYKVPRRVEFVAELPRLGSGKVDRRRLGAIAAAAAAAMAPSGTEVDR